MRRKDKLKLYNYLANTDIPMLMFIGFGLGFLMSGVMFITLGSFIEAGDGEIWSLTTMLSGIMLVGVSAIIGLFAVLYWWSVPRKSGTLYPKLNGFGLILLVMSCIVGLAISIFLIM